MGKRGEFDAGFVGAPASTWPDIWSYEQSAEKVRKTNY